MPKSGYVQMKQKDFRDSFAILFNEVCNDVELEPCLQVFKSKTFAKLWSCLPTLKSSFDRDLEPNVVYKMKCNWYVSIYVGQTGRQVTTRISEH